MSSYFNKLKRFFLYTVALLIIPVSAALACQTDCDCGLGGRCFFISGIEEGLCVRTSLQTFHVYEDFYHICLIFDEDREIDSKNLAKMNESDLKRELVKHSRESYKTLTHRRCACPYDVSSIGEQCGAYSAYIRNQELSPLCYEEDVDKHHIERYKGLFIDQLIDQPQVKGAGQF